MKHILHTILVLSALLLLWTAPASAQRTVSYYADYALFQHSNGRPYVEVHLNADAASLYFTKQADGLYGAKVSFSLTLLKAPDYTEVYSDVVELNTQTVADTGRGATSFFAMHLLRWTTEPGTYALYVQARDPNAPQDTTIETVLEFELAPPVADTAISSSSIVWLAEVRKPMSPNSPFYKHGFGLIPFVTNSYFYNQDTLKWYVELYGLKKARLGKFQIHSWITEAGSNYLNKTYEKWYSLQDAKDDPNLFAAAVYIGSLPSQTYNLNVEVLDENKKVVFKTHKKFFSYTDREAMVFRDPTSFYDHFYSYSEKELNALLPSLQYVATSAEMSFMKALTSYDEKKKYFFTFWKKRQKDPANPTREWFTYYNKVQYANRNFRNSLSPGWASDRGRVLLTYGPPSDVQGYELTTDSNPYSIWTYDNLKGQSGVIFVFADMQKGTGQYQLVHSTLRGEVYLANWREYIAHRELAPNSSLSNNTTDTQDPTSRDFLPRTTGQPTNTQPINR